MSSFPEAWDLGARGLGPLLCWAVQDGHPRESENPPRAGLGSGHSFSSPRPMEVPHRALRSLSCPACYPRSLPLLSFFFQPLGPGRSSILWV